MEWKDAKDSSTLVTLLFLKGEGGGLELMY